MQKNKKILIATGIIVTLLAGGFFYFWYVWVPNEMAKQEAENKLTNTPPPTLFGKDDYKIENRTDGTYVLIDKVGLTAKVPEGWETEKINNSNENNTNYWINLSSPDAEFKDILIKGCGISILSGTSQENYSTIKEKINDPTQIHQSPLP